MFKFSLFEEDLMYSVEDRFTDFEFFMNLNEDMDVILDRLYWSFLVNKANISLNLLEFMILKLLEEFVEEVGYYNMGSLLNYVPYSFDEWRNIKFDSRKELEEFLCILDDVLLRFKEAKDNHDSKMFIDTFDYLDDTIEYNFFM